MSKTEQILDYSAAQAYYDKFGKKQDSQGFYEDPALDDLIAQADFQEIQSVFEFGCGTGKFAARILENHLPSTASYLGCDISPVMVDLANQRLKTYDERAKVILSNDTLQFPIADYSVDRIVSSYVLDLLSEADIQRFLSESLRVLKYPGMVCLVSLTRGVTLPSRIVSSLWMKVFRMRPSLVGGCRPIRLESYIDFEQWQLKHKRILSPYGVPSEVLILKSKDMPDKNNEVITIHSSKG